MPVRATTGVKDLQGSSYVFAILTDHRITGIPRFGFGFPPVVHVG
jgi:hypothetical protein